MAIDTDKLEAVAAKAEALRIAERYCLRMGWKYSPEDIGAYARRILGAMTEGERNG